MRAEDKISLLEGHLSEADTATISMVLKEAEMAGIRKVVEWLSSHSHCGTAGGASFCVANWEWQSQLKEWFKDNPELLKELGVSDEKRT